MSNLTAASGPAEGSVAAGPAAARATYLATVPIHAMIYFTPHAATAYEAVGLRGRRMGYFASRAAAMGPVSADVVIATFFNFNPGLIRSSIPDAWALATPGAILGARLDAADLSLRQAWGDGVNSPEVAEAAELARIAALAAALQPQGRPLFAGHAALPWPTEPHLVLWHAQTLLREYRGDGHVTLLTAAGLTPVEALVTHAAVGVSAETLRRSRAWSEDEWEAGVASVRARGWLAEGESLALSDAGQAFRQDLEDRTDELAAGAWAVLGEAGCVRLAELGQPLSQAIIDSGLYGPGSGASLLRPSAG